MFYVDILTNKRYGTLYTGFTNNLALRLEAHRQKSVEGSTKTYETNLLVWYECHQDPMAARTREKQIKKWNRDWKINLIQAKNPDWHDLSNEVAA